MTNWSKMADSLMDTKTLPGAVFVGVLCALAAILIGRAVRLAIDRYLDNSERAGADPTGIRFLGQLARIAVYILGFVCYAHLVPALQKLGTASLAIGGVASVVVGLAAQSTLGNLISGISIVLYRPFKIGDRMRVFLPSGQETGMVESIDLGYTALRTADKRRLIIPNNIMASQACVDLSLLPPRTPCDVSIYVAAGGDLDRARKILLDLAKADQRIAQVDGCRFTRVTSKGVILTLAAATADPDAAAGVRSDLLENASKQFEAAGIKIA
ncbi:MAG: mechanosensitive ion channel family protein [Verrucomicrobiota bacterium]|jgi:small-conductance mechanosensitive channel